MAAWLEQEKGLTMTDNHSFSCIKVQGPRSFVIIFGQTPWLRIIKTLCYCSMFINRSLHLTGVRGISARCCKNLRVVP